MGGPEYIIQGKGKKKKRGGTPKFQLRTEKKSGKQIKELPHGGILGKEGKGEETVRPPSMGSRKRKPRRHKARTEL